MSLAGTTISLTDWAEPAERTQSEAKSGGDAVRALLPWLAENFQWRKISGVWGGVTLVEEPTQPFADETVDESPLTRLNAPAAESILVPEGQYRCIWYGALWHRPPIADFASAWYAHIRTPLEPEHPKVLLPIASLVLDTAGDPASVRFRLPFGGYPLTSLAPMLEEGYAVRTLDLTAVEENRQLLFSWLARLPSVLGWSAQAEWEINWDDALYEDDREALKSWQQRLKEGTA